MPLDASQGLDIATADDLAEAQRVQMPMQVPIRPGGKLGLIIDQLSTASGATADELAAVTGWQKHTVLGALSRLRSRGFLMRRDPEGGHSRYRLERPD